MRFVDSHAHLDFPQFDADRTEIIANLSRQDIDVINISTSVESVPEAVKIATTNKRIWALVGVHPTDITQDILVELPRHIAEWDEIIHANSKVVGVGEIGLDYFHDKSTDSANRQKAALRQMLTWASEKDYPVSFHCREAYGDLVTILADYPGLRGVVHCFSGNTAQADAFLRLGLHISFTAIITYPKNEALRQVVQATPLEKILVETDCPFLPAFDKRGSRNDPTTVVTVAQTIADLKNISLEEVAEATSQAADQLFGLEG